MSAALSAARRRNIFSEARKATFLRGLWKATYRRCSPPPPVTDCVKSSLCGLSGDAMTVMIGSRAEGAARRLLCLPQRRLCGSKAAGAVVPRLSRGQAD